MKSNRVEQIRENAVRNSEMYKQAIDMGIPEEDAFKGAMETLHVLSAVFMSAIHAAVENGVSSTELANRMDIIGEATLSAFYNAGGNDPELHKLLAMIMAAQDMDDEDE